MAWPILVVLGVALLVERREGDRSGRRVKPGELAGFLEQSRAVLGAILHR